jgi:hypothetical protein
MPARRFPPLWSVEELDACFVVLLVRTGLVERTEHRQDVLKIFRVLIRVVQRLEQGEVFSRATDAIARTRRRSR